MVTIKQEIKDGTRRGEYGRKGGRNEKEEEISLQDINLYFRCQSEAQKLKKRTLLTMMYFYYSKGRILFAIIYF
jgi:hypothetical protein